MTCFDSFVVERIPKEIKKITSNEKYHNKMSLKYKALIR